jgi:hypothetical protein
VPPEAILRAGTVTDDGDSVSSSSYSGSDGLNGTDGMKVLEGFWTGRHQRKQLESPRTVAQVAVNRRRLTWGRVEFGEVLGSRVGRHTVVGDLANYRSAPGVESAGRGLSRLCFATERRADDQPVEAAKAVSKSITLRSRRRCSHPRRTSSITGSIARPTRTSSRRSDAKKASRFASGAAAPGTPWYALFTMSKVRTETPDVIVSMGAEGRQRLGTSAEFAGTLHPWVPHSSLTDAEAEAASEFVERLQDDGAHTGLIDIAPHSGAVEQCTDLQTERVAERLADKGKGVNAWRCKGWKQGGGAYRRWHITPVHIHEASFPQPNKVISRGFNHAVAFHGFSGEGVLGGGGSAAAALKSKNQDGY